ncbi:unnamed protein product [Heligmosomoides polygyrus]|uniref:Uncharacterized protein n=1 Tax=Heligmosomoides polygyrus TaxID=6339 RepID=A0A3P8AFB9_HELPZ|nr:unnamed protein product [Heligmosomoides polygyrus]
MKLAQYCELFATPHGPQPLILFAVREIQRDLDVIGGRDLSRKSSDLARLLHIARYDAHEKSIPIVLVLIQSGARGRKSVIVKLFGPLIGPLHPKRYGNCILIEPQANLFIAVRWPAHKLTWLGDSRDHQGGNPIVRPSHCTFAWADLCGSFSLRGSRCWTAHNLTWLGDSRDHQGGNPIVRPSHCTLAWADLCGSFSLRLANS